MHWQDQLDSILSEDLATACQRERAAFDAAAGRYAESLVLYGAGKLGRKVLQGLRGQNLQPLAFADSNPALAGKIIDGIPVLAPADAVKKFGKHSVFVICVWHPARECGIREIGADLSALGAERVAPFVWLFWKYAETFLPYYLWDLPSKLLAEAEEIRRGVAILANDGSRQQFTAHLLFRSRADFDCLPAPAPLPAYFPRELFRLCEDEFFVDCGAYDGDTIRDFVRESGGRFRGILAFEPDPVNFRALQLAIAADEGLRARTRVCNVAVGRSPGKVRLAVTGQGSSAIHASGGVETDCTTLDNALRDQRPTFIKMDIEGEEEAALIGGRQTISRHQPVLAVCVYHRQNDLWKLPLLMHELEPESKLTLRAYYLDGFDLVAFAVPPDRLRRN
ncbi:MAG: FkbM family methyltransferase [Terriglobales bacterium]